MNEIYIYSKMKYKKILKCANQLFSSSYKWYCPRSVFAQNNNTYSVSINKNCIHICYWDEDSENGKKAKYILEKFLYDNFSGSILVVSTFGKCEILNNLHTIQLM